MVHEVVDMADFQNQLKAAGDKLVVVDFTATWCGPCRRIAPIFVELSKKHEDVVFLKVDVDKANDVAKACAISCMPTFQFYKNKNMVSDFSGADEEKLASEIIKLKH